MESEAFPYTNYAGISCPTVLRNELNRLGLRDPKRAELLAAIWGYGSETFKELAHALRPELAEAFGLTDLATHLAQNIQDSTKNEGLEKENIGPENGQENQKKKKEEEKEIREEEKSREINFVPREREQAFNKWLGNGSNILGQSEANILRKGLNMLYKWHVKSAWLGLSKNLTLQGGISIINIHLPRSAGNRLSSKAVSFCNEEVFNDSTKNLVFHNVTLALMRYDHFNNGEDKPQWIYPGGFDDYLVCLDFASKWVPLVMEERAKQERTGLLVSLREHVTTAIALGQLSQSDTMTNKVNGLLATTESIHAQFPLPVCDHLATRREEMLKVWETQRSAWLDLVAPNDHAMEGDLVRACLPEVIGNPDIPVLSRFSGPVLTQLTPVHETLSLLDDCFDVEDYESVMQQALQLVSDLQVSGHIPLRRDISPQVLIEAIQKAMDGRCWRDGKLLLGLFKEQSIDRKCFIINQINGDKIALLYTALREFQNLVNLALPVLTLHNLAFGGEQVANGQKKVQEIVDKLTSEILHIKEAINDLP